LQGADAVQSASDLESREKFEDALGQWVSRALTRRDDEENSKSRQEPAA
jgi:hypothetical protein